MSGTETRLPGDFVSGVSVLLSRVSLVLSGVSVFLLFGVSVLLLIWVATAGVETRQLGACVAVN